MFKCVTLGVYRLQMLRMLLKLSSASVYVSIVCLLIAKVMHEHILITRALTTQTRPSVHLPLPGSFLAFLCTISL